MAQNKMTQVSACGVRKLIILYLNDFFLEKFEKNTMVCIVREKLKKNL